MTLAASSWYVMSGILSPGNFCCREVTGGFDTLTKLEEVETIKEGIFVMPKQRIHILSTYVYSDTGSVSNHDAVSNCQHQLADLQERFDAQSKHVEHIRAAKLP